VNVVITAGGAIAGDYAALAGTPVKALACVRGRTMLDRAIDAAYAAGAARVAVVGGNAVAAACASRVDKIVEQSEDGGENVIRALSAWPVDKALLYLTSDLPYVTGEALGAFVARVPDGSMGVCLSSYAAFARRFPSAPPFGITLAGERVVNGGAFMIPAGCAPRAATIAKRFFGARKSRWAMARLLGPSLIARYLIGRLSIAALEGWATATLGLRACAVRDAGPELAYDADLIEEYRYACEHA
jgi:GTP:adenosylcobinamide-phosphate guanylyltransferase